MTVDQTRYYQYIGSRLRQTGVTMDSDLYCEDYFVPASEQVKQFITTIAKWKQHNQMLYGSDVLNIAIESGLITAGEVTSLISQVKSTVDLQLPNKYIE
jgi:hypothetical protein